MDHAEAPHRYLLKYLQLVELDLQDSLPIEAEGVLVVLLLLHGYLLELPLELLNLALLAPELVFDLDHLPEGLAAGHFGLLALEPGRSLRYYCHTSLPPPVSRPKHFRNAFCKLSEAFLSSRC